MLGVVVANYAGNCISLYAGVGVGSPVFQSYLTMGSSPRPVAVGSCRSVQAIVIAFPGRSRRAWRDGYAWTSYPPRPDYPMRQHLSRSQLEIAFVCRTQ